MHVLIGLIYSFQQLHIYQDIMVYNTDVHSFVNSTMIDSILWCSAACHSSTWTDSGAGVLWFPPAFLSHHPSREWKRALILGSQPNMWETMPKFLAAGFNLFQPWHLQPSKQWTNTWKILSLWLSLSVFLSPSFSLICHLNQHLFLKIIFKRMQKI